MLGRFFFIFVNLYSKWTLLKMVGFGLITQSNIIGRYRLSVCEYMYKYRGVFSTKTALVESLLIILAPTFFP